MSLDSAVASRGELEGADQGFRLLARALTVGASLLLVACAGSSTSQDAGVDAGPDGGSDAGLPYPYVVCVWGRTALFDAGAGYEIQASFQADRSVVCPGTWAYLTALTSQGVPGPFQWESTTTADCNFPGPGQGSSRELIQEFRLTDASYDGVTAVVLSVDAGTSNPTTPDGGYVGQVVSQKGAPLNGATCCGLRGRSCHQDLDCCAPLSCSGSCQ
jgi:hypothetical protein